MIDTAPLFSCQQIDLIRVDATGACHLHSVGRHWPSSSLRVRRECLIVNLIGPGNQIGGAVVAFHSNSTIHRDVAGDQVYAAQASAIETRGANRQLPTAHTETGEAVGPTALAGDQGGTISVDEATTIASNAIGVRNHHIGRRTKHLNAP
ncbi:hypothetical protein RQP53_14955 [Paucibacter sp. APW11]|uniref:Uncharacterized protein n=1 Tax=Roseateles aquae TaxID=3077235 RepID=A0ABU3PF77_9BURK|nr:hypothetical protein [Paucibacter sp. APW11]MDT9000571.1 hypothetical protein [Paucibacter sp. APW11]